MTTENNAAVNDAVREIYAVLEGMSCVDAYHALKTVLDTLGDNINFSSAIRPAENENDFVFDNDETGKPYWRKIR